MGIAEFLTFVLLMIKLFSTTQLTWVQVFLPMIILYSAMVSSFVIYITIGITLVVRDELKKCLSKH
jgi:hypothetical protein